MKKIGTEDNSEKWKEKFSMFFWRVNVCKCCRLLSSTSSLNSGITYCVQHRITVFLHKHTAAINQTLLTDRNTDEKYVKHLYFQFHWKQTVVFCRICSQQYKVPKLKRKKRGLGNKKRSLKLGGGGLWIKSINHKCSTWPSVPFSTLVSY